MADEKPCYPIIYVRGYAGTQDDVEETVDDPFYGFNLGSTHVRIGPQGDPQFFAFAGPLLRLITERNYTRVYEGNVQQVVSGLADPTRSSTIWIYRYYDATTKTFGASPRRLSIEEAAEGLRVLIKEVTTQSGKVVLVAHSMGGLICRSLIQKIYPDRDEDPTNHIDRFITYGTPHGGIHFDVGGGLLEWIRDGIGWNNSDDFGYQRMWEFLTPKSQKRENTYPQDFEKRANEVPNFPVDRMFSIIGTNAADYAVLYGASRKGVGPKSDGLVQTQHAYIKGAPRAYVHRSHSGRYGIVNSEEGYQNLQRFLFGDIRVNMALSNLSLQHDDRHFYQADVRVSIRGLPIFVNEQSVAHSCPIPLDKDASGVYPLFTAYLMPRLSHSGDGICRYTIDLTVFAFTKRDGVFSFNDHIEGLPFWSDWLVVDVKDGASGTMRYDGTYGWLSEMSGYTDPQNPILAAASAQGDGIRITIPLPPKAQEKLGSHASVILDTYAWNGAYRL